MNRQGRGGGGLGDRNFGIAAREFLMRFKKEVIFGKKDSLGNVCKQDGQNIFMIGMFIIDYFQYCFLGKGKRGVKGVLFTSDCL